MSAVLYPGARVGGWTLQVSQTFIGSDPTWLATCDAGSSKLIPVAALRSGPLPNCGSTCVCQHGGAA